MIADRPHEVEVRTSAEPYRGAIWGVVRDEIRLSDGWAVRDYVQHMGAVAVVALDDVGQVLVITQYRHAVGHVMVELPAGLLDSPGEDPAAAAARELMEETGYRAADWQVLVDICTSPGSTSEALRIFLATGLEQVRVGGHGLAGEELDIELHWVPLTEAVAAVLAGKWQNPTAVTGVLAAAQARGGELRPADASWPLRDWEVANGRVFRR